MAWRLRLQGGRVAGAADLMPAGGHSRSPRPFCLGMPNCDALQHLAACLPVCPSARLPAIPPCLLQDILKKEDGVYIKYAMGSMLNMRYQVGGWVGGRVAGWGGGWGGVGGGGGGGGGLPALHCSLQHRMRYQVVGAPIAQDCTAQFKQQCSVPTPHPTSQPQNSLAAAAAAAAAYLMGACHPPACGRSGWACWRRATLACPRAAGAASCGRQPPASSSPPSPSPPTTACTSW